VSMIVAEREACLDRGTKKTPMLMFLVILTPHCVDSALSPGTPVGHHANSAMTGKPSTANKWMCLARTLFRAPHLTSLRSHKLS
jgi:hypothetical protein